MMGGLIRIAEMYHKGHQEPQSAQSYLRVLRAFLVGFVLLKSDQNIIVIFE